MITEDLIAYIQAQLRKKVPIDEISARLARAGWHKGDIDEGIQKIVPPRPVKSASPIAQPVRSDTSHIHIEKVHIESVPVKAPAVSAVAQFNTELPAHTKLPEIAEQRMSAPTVASLPIEPKITPPASVAPAPFIPRAVPITYIVPESAKATQPITPSSPFGVPPINLPVASLELPKAVAPVSIAPQNTELIPTLIPKVEKSQASPVSTPPLVSSPVSMQTPSSQPSSVIESMMSPVAHSQNNQSSTANAQKPPSSIINNLPKSALIYSYARDFSSASKVNEVSFKKKTSRAKWIFVLILIIIAAIAVAGFSGYITIPESAFSFIKKDPKAAILNAPMKFASLKSYKTETIASVTSPSFANITSGLVSGDKVISSDKDSISVNAKGMVNQADGVFSTGYLATIKSSLLKNDIATGLKYDGTASYVYIPDLRSVFDLDIPKVVTVSVLNGQFDLITSEFSHNIQGKIKSADVYKILSKGIPPYVYNESTRIFKEFLDMLEVSDKGSEIVHGNDTYHYSMIASRPATKKFLTDIVNIFLPSNLSDAQRSSLDEGLGATTLDSFEVWVSKDDNFIRQFAFSLTTPLSKVIGLDDKGIDGNSVTLSWKTSYYDFDIANDITMPQGSIPVADFLKSVRDARIKKTISSFSAVAQSLRNAEGRFGSKVNASGSCTNPASGSLFSPLGHTKGAASAVGSIASSMNMILDIAGTGYCYSTPSAWSLAVPLASDTKSLFCVDSAGASATLPSAPKGSMCK